MKKYLELPENAFALRGRKVLTFEGSMTTAERVAVTKLILTSEEPMLMFTTFQVGGVGHNFQMFTMVIFLDRNWNPQVFLYFFLFLFHIWQF